MLAIHGHTFDAIVSAIAKLWSTEPDNPVISLPINIENRLFREPFDAMRATLFELEKENLIGHLSENYDRKSFSLFVKRASHSTWRAVLDEFRNWLYREEAEKLCKELTMISSYIY